MKILSYDPGLNGAGIIVMGLNKEILKHVSFKSNSKFSQEKRLGLQYQIMEEFLVSQGVSWIVTERQFKTNMVYPEALTRILAGVYNIPIKIYHPSTWKKSFTKDHKASKEKVREYIYKHFNKEILDEMKLTEHEVDAIALALTFKFECEKINE